jgi:hypothetical protein
MFNNMDKSERHSAKWKKPDTKGHALYNSFMWNSSKGETIVREGRAVDARGQRQRLED